HAERGGDVAAEEFVERYARRLLDDAAEHVGVVAVDVLFARLRLERQRPQAFHGRADRLVLVGEIPAETGGEPEALLLVDRVLFGTLAVRDARGVREQVADRDGALGR